MSSQSENCGRKQEQRNVFSAEEILVWVLSVSMIRVQQSMNSLISTVSRNAQRGNTECNPLEFTHTHTYHWAHNKMCAYRM